MSTKITRWCQVRDIHRTFTPGSDPKSNGRAERAVQEVKNRVRTMLLEAKATVDWWPIVVRNLNERWRAQRAKKSDNFPPFLSEVLMKKRWWHTREEAAGQLAPVMERVKYLSPSWVNHGHWVMREDGSKVLTRSVITHTVEPIPEGCGSVWRTSWTP